MKIISFALTAKLICVFAFEYLKCWFSHDAAHCFIGIHYGLRAKNLGHFIIVVDF